MWLKVGGGFYFKKYGAVNFKIRENLSEWQNLFCSIVGKSLSFSTFPHWDCDQVCLRPFEGEGGEDWEGVSDLVPLWASSETLHLCERTIQTFVFLGEWN